MLDRTGGPISGAKNWSSGYMPATYAGTVFRPEGSPINDLTLPTATTRPLQRDVLDSLARTERASIMPRGPTSTIWPRGSRATNSPFDAAARPRGGRSEPGNAESRAISTVSIDDQTRDFGTRCLLARRLVERGVRFIQVYSGGSHNDDNWDAHGDLVANHTKHAGATDQPIAGLLKDLKQRGLLEETLVVWGGEFGRQPTAEYDVGTGRDHNSYGFTMWMAGGGVKGGVSVGATDEIGSAAVDEPMHVKRLHATVLQQLGLDPNRLSYFYRRSRSETRRCRTRRTHPANHRMTLTTSLNTTY